MWKKELLEFYKCNKGKVNGVIIGLLFAILVISIGFFKTLFLAICVFIGYYIGKKSDNNESIIEILQRFIHNGWK